jgi:hypothetical protein
MLTFPDWIYCRFFIYSISGLRVYFSEGIETQSESIDIGGIDKECTFYL